MTLVALGVSYFGNRFADHYRERDLPAIVDAGCGFVVHTFSEHDHTYYTEALHALVTATHDAGLQAWLDPWGVGGLFAGEAFSDFLVRHPDSWQVRPDGTRVAQACPNAPASRELIVQWVDAAAATGADVVFWDDPSLPDGTDKRSGCVCGHCHLAFLAHRGVTIPIRDHLTVTAFQRESMLAFIGDACAMAKARGLRNVVGVVPGAARGGEAALEALTSIPSVDTIATSPLWRAHRQPLDAYVTEAAADLVAACRRSGKRSMGWLQAFGIPVGAEEEIGRAAKLLANAGVEAIAAWSYWAGEPMTPVRSGDPGAAWQAVRSAFAALSDR
jgi:hypothetical protein